MKILGRYSSYHDIWKYELIPEFLIVKGDMISVGKVR